MRKVAALLSILAIPSLPTASLAQAAAVPPLTAANSWLNRAALVDTSVSAGALCLLNTDCTWRGQNKWAVNFDGTTGNPSNYPIIYHTGAYAQGIVSPRSAVVLQLVGVPSNPVNSGEINIIDAFAYNGYAAINAERYDRGGPNNGRVLAHENIGNIGFDPYDGVSDANTAGFGCQTTEEQIHDTNHGTGCVLWYTPAAAGANKRYTAISFGWGGLGGVGIGEASYQVPVTDLGPGTLNVASDIVSHNHYRSRGPAPTVTSCGSSPSITGTDNAGAVGTGGAVTACTVKFKAAWNAAPICIVQTRNSATPVAYISAGPTTTAFTVAFSASLNGGFSYICQGVS
jgi:hypothetical protein